MICYQRRSTQIKGAEGNDHRHLATDQRKELYPFNLKPLYYVHTQHSNGIRTTSQYIHRIQETQTVPTDPKPKEFAVCHIQTPPRINLLVSHDDIRRTSDYLLSKFRITTNCMFSTSWHPPTVIPAESSAEAEVKEANSFIL